MAQPYDTKPDMYKVHLEQQQHMSMPHTYGDPQGPQSNGTPYHVEPHLQQQHLQQQQHQQSQPQPQQPQEYGYPPQQHPQHPQHPQQHMQHPQQMQQQQQQHPNGPPQNMQYVRPQQPPQQVQPAVDLTPVSKVQSARNNHGPRRFKLEIAQQPDRARMCGFGDKDRRPITPPPCIRLVIYDENTGEELDYSQMDCPHFILQVDLWNPDASAAVNCVQHSNTSPSVSISMATTTSYPPQPEMNNFMVHSMPGAGGYMGQQQYQYQAGYYPTGPGGAMMPTTSGNYTRNLIGSCSVSAYSLMDQDEDIGLWFVLQDLSVRTEGSFRLKFSFIDIGEFMGKDHTPTKVGETVPVLASAFSDVFTVWSAKKFPGVKESTALSKCFAGQGVKIPIRKEGGGKGGKGGDDDDGAGDD